MRELTLENLTQYNKEETMCPVCRIDSQTVYNGIKYDNGGAYQDCSCKVCKSKWIEIYQIVAVRITKEKE